MSHVLPGAFAISRAQQRSGRGTIAAVAVSFEISYRLGGAAMSGYRDAGLKPSQSSVVGYGSTLFGATASANSCAGWIPKAGQRLGIAAATAPVSSQRCLVRNARLRTIRVTRCTR